MKKILLLIVGLVGVFLIGVGEGKSQNGLGGGLSPAGTPSRDPGALFDEISRGKGFVSYDEDLSGYESLRDTFQAYVQATNFTTNQMSREDYIKFMAWRQQQHGKPGKKGHGFPSGMRGIPDSLTPGAAVQDPAAGAPATAPVQGEPQAAHPGSHPNGLAGIQGLAGEQPPVHIPHQLQPQELQQQLLVQQQLEQQRQLQQQQLLQQLQQQQLQQQQLIQQPLQQLTPEQDAAMMVKFKQHPLNAEGFLTREGSSARLKEQWEFWDWDHNDLIDFEEYKAYSLAGAAGFTPKKGSPNPYVPKWVSDDLLKRPTVYRKDNLPAELPPWFNELAGEEVAQVYLYDWRAAGKNDAEFFAMDRNGDGILTVEEVLSYLKKKSSAKGSGSGADAGVAAPSPGIGGRRPKKRPPE
jgi:hypothetical protein